LDGYISDSVKTYRSNYDAIERRQISSKYHFYNKSRYQALKQNKNQQQQHLALPRTRRISDAVTVGGSVVCFVFFHFKIFCSYL
jgi:hypothetical protein